MLAGLLCALVLLGTLVVLRVGRGGARCESEPVPAALSGDRWLGAIGILLAELPLLQLAPRFNGAPLIFWGDTQSHARVAAELARSGLPHGWIHGYVGGFPFGHHYPPLGWLLLAAEMRAGLEPADAVYLLGFFATLALPLSLYLGLLRCGVPPSPAGIGCTLLCWVSPYNSFVGGYETFFTAGLVSQVIALPIVTWVVVATLKPGARWEVVAAGWLSMASHPQVTVAALVVLGVAACALARRDLLINTLYAWAIALLAGVALYGQGIGSLDIPFGWPPNMGWRQLGFPPARLRWWLEDGDLLDLDRVPVFTALLAASFLLLLLDSRRPSSRSLAAAIVSTLALSVSGAWLRGFGTLGAALLSFLQPLRVISLVPALAAVCVAVAIARGADRLALALEVLGRPALARTVTIGIPVLVAGLAVAAVPSRLRYVDAVLQAQLDEVSCMGGADPARSDPELDELRAAVATLSGGRLWYDAYGDTLLRSCIARGGVEIASAVPIATAAAVGAHVGVLAHAAHHLDPDRPGSAERAEALGIAYLLLERGEGSPPPGWTVRHQWDNVQLASQPAELVGVGCVERRWRGSPDLIRARLNRDLAEPTKADPLLRPHSFTALEYASGPLSESPEPGTSCRYSGASVRDVMVQGGVVSAAVQASSAVDVVLRVSAFPAWRIEIDGALVDHWTLIAPGFMSVRLPPGQHELRATAGLLPHYGAWTVLALLASAGLALSRGRVLEWLLARFNRSRLARG